MQSTPQYKIEVVDNLGSSQQRELTGSVEIGRSSNANIKIETDPYLERFHLKLEQTESGVKITDLNSRVGSYIKIDSVPIVQQPPFDLVVGSSLIRVKPAERLTKE